MTRTLLAGLLLGLAACQSTGAPATVPHWSLVEEMRFGGADTGRASFTDILALDLGPDGSVWLIDRDVPEIRVFDRQGTFVRTIGRPGQGPGEMAATNGFAFAPGGLVWVPDHGNRRYNLFDTTGRFIASHPDLIHGYGYRWEGGVDGQGRLFDPITVRRDTTYLPVLRRFRDTSLALADTIPEPTCSGGTHATYHLKARNGETYMRVPYAASQVGAYTRDGLYWCSPGDASAAVAIRLEDGDTVARIAYSRPRLPVSTTARDSVIARITKQANEMGADLPDFSLIPGVQAAVIGIRVDDGGRVWLRVPDPDSLRFDIFDRDGHRIAEVAGSKTILGWGPIAFRGDTLLAVVHDADDTPAVVRLRLDRGERR